MTKAVFTTRVNPSYDDLPEVRYHFPKSYLNQVTAAVDDWIVYYEPRRHDSGPSARGGWQAYFATAFITGIREDSSLADHFYADVRDYLEFDRPVPFKEEETYYENALRREDGQTSKGAFGRAVRSLPEHEYETILASGFRESLIGEPSRNDTGFAEPAATFERPIIEQVVARPFRDAAFARAIREAYESTCAVTGLKLLNGGGRVEIEAAHIRPIGDGHMGPDSVRNGLALSRTVHWMFDRGLVSISDDYRLLVSKAVPTDALHMFPPHRQIRLPDIPNLQPHKQFLRYHREHIYKD